jgi:hypothetical protein
MLTQDDINYALENTNLVLPPERRIETFGTSILNYYLVTEEMDSTGESRVREGTIVAEKPQILTPQNLSKLLLDGFGDKAQQFADLISNHSDKFAVLKYGFTMRKSDVRVYEVHDPFEAVVNRVVEEVKAKNNPGSAVLTGVDDAWEVCLVKFMMDMVTSSGEANLRDLRRRGLI